MWERRNNLTIRGLNAEERKEKTSVEELLEKDLRTGGKIKKARRQGTRGNGVIIVEMETWEAKQEAMRNKTRLGARKVYVNHDITYKEREIQRRIREREGRESFFKVNKRGEGKRGEGKGKGKKRKHGGEKEVKMAFWRNI